MNADGPILSGRMCRPGSSSVGDHFAEQHVDAAGPLVDDGVQPEEAGERRATRARRSAAPGT